MSTGAEVAPAGRGGFNGPAARGGFSGPGGARGGFSGPGARGGFSGPGARGGVPPATGGAGGGPGGLITVGQAGGPMGGPVGGQMGGPMGGPGMRPGGVVQQQGPPCEMCMEPIVGRMVSAVGKHYHPDHFVCENCSQPFPGGKFCVGPDQKLYCEQDFMELYAKICNVCKGVIKGKAVTTATGLSYHSEHFVCVSCGCNLVNKQYKVHNDAKGNTMVYCPVCYEKDVRVVRPEAHPCAMCGEPIVGPYLQVKGQYLHPRHFRCEECGIEFRGGDCREFEGDFYCIPHYEILILKKCAKCGKPCKGRSMTALGKTWHNDHFTCHICNEPFVGGNYLHQDGLPYCQIHYAQLFGDQCAHCNQPILVGGMKFQGKAFHDEHFRCSSCEKILKIGEFTAWDGKAMCMPCYKQIPKAVRKRVQHRAGAEKAAKFKRRKGEEKIFNAEQQ